MDDLDKSPYSFHFNYLKLIGGWGVRTTNKKIIYLYVVYKVFMTWLATSGCFGLCVDFYMVFGDLKKMTWNLCVTTLFCGGIAKNVISFHQFHILNRVRLGLHRDGLSRNTPEDEAINASALRELKFVRVSFYGICALFIPVWLITRHLSYLWGPREEPLPLRIPIDYDPEDDLQYNYVFAGMAVGGVAGISFVLENELAMFGILIQISREYKRLLKDIPKLDGLIPDCDFENVGQAFEKEINPILRNLKITTLIKEFSSRQQKLIEYTEHFESCYNKTMILQVFELSVIAISVSIQVLIQSSKVTVHISYQLAYDLILLIDLFLVCSLATRIRDQCLAVGEKIYSTLWYQMKTSVQKDIRMIIMRAQRPPKITSGKIMELNLHAFMIVIRNIYSWLALYKQFEAKVSNS